MLFLLSLLMLAISVSNITQFDLSLAPGLSAKNALLYVAASFIGFRFAVSGSFRVEIGGIIGCFLALTLYCIASLLFVGWFLDYRNYSMVASTISLKNLIVDPMLFMLTFFYGARNAPDALKLTKVLLLCGGLMNLANLSTAFGIYRFGDYVEPLTGGRMGGPLAEANQYAAFLGLFLPALVCATLQAKSAMRVVWFSAILASLACLLTTASRGGIAAIIVAALIGAYILRDRLDAAKVGPFLLKASAIGIVVLGAMSIEFGDLLHSRFVSETQVVGAANLSSGRTEQWVTMLNRMMAEPITLLTGFGWNSFGVMGFFIEAHNYFLSMWFNVGLPGLLLGTGTFVLPLTSAYQASAVADPQFRGYLIAFVFGILIALLSQLLVELYTPLPYLWAYVGLTLRIAVSQKARSGASPANAPKAEQLTPAARIQ